jgi:hypothetical protein
MESQRAQTPPAEGEKKVKLSEIRYPQFTSLTVDLCASVKTMYRATIMRFTRHLNSVGCP